MPNAFDAIAFTDAVKAVQTEQGSRDAYARRELGNVTTNERLGEDATAFIAARDSFYMATVGATGWPYIQHRGGQPGFVRVLDAQTLEIPDFGGNRQYVTVGNLATEDRVCLFFMDYPNRFRLKIFGRATVLPPEGSGADSAGVERMIRVRVAAFDWNCPQHITPRFTLPEVEAAMEPLRARIAALEAGERPDEL